jgi:hypothetical protein
LLSGSFTALGHLDSEFGQTALAKATKIAEQSGEMAYKELLQMHRNHTEEQVQAEMIPIALVRVQGGPRWTPSE